MKLNLPEYNPQLRKTELNTEIYDIIRKKYVILTPEEWVRQHFVNYLITELKYSENMISVEHGLKYQQLIKRIDICIYNTEGKPFILIECKAPYINISLDTISQISTYASTLKDVTYLCLTNGIAHFFYKRSNVNFEITNFLPANNN